MKYLLDTSVIAVLLARRKEKALGILEKYATLDLTFYKFGNIIWEECVLFKKITLKKALNRAAEAFTILWCMKIYSVAKP